MCRKVSAPGVLLLPSTRKGGPRKCRRPASMAVWCSSTRREGVSGRRISGAVLVPMAHVVPMDQLKRVLNYKPARITPTPPRGVPVSGKARWSNTSRCRASPPAIRQGASRRPGTAGRSALRACRWRSTTRRFSSNWDWERAGRCRDRGSCFQARGASNRGPNDRWPDNRYSRREAVAACALESLSIAGRRRPRARRAHRRRARAFCPNGWMYGSSPEGSRSAPGRQGRRVAIASPPSHLEPRPTGSGMSYGLPCAHCQISRRI
jgi:hypothetical protein